MLLTAELTRVEDAARRILEGETVPELGIRILPGKGDGPFVAGLVTLERRSGDLILPMRKGRNLVCRAKDLPYGAHHRELAGVVEGGQWVITWAERHVTVSDMQSTNGSALIPKEHRASTPLRLHELKDNSNIRWLGWDGKVFQGDAFELRDGDLLVNAYGAFLYFEARAHSRPASG